MTSDRERLTAAELNELTTLAFRRANDLPFGPQDQERFNELRRKEGLRD